MKRFLCEYPYQGDRWGFEIYAIDEADAKARLKAIGWGEVSGQLMATIPGWVPSPLIGAFIWVQNLRKT